MIKVSRYYVKGEILTLKFHYTAWLCYDKTSILPSTACPTQAKLQNAGWGLVTHFA